MTQVEQAFQDVFGPYAGWAHNVLFVSELASQKHRLPGSKAEALPRCARVCWSCGRLIPGLKGSTVLLAALH